MTWAPRTSAAWACGTSRVSVVTGPRPPAHTIRFGMNSAIAENPAAMASARRMNRRVAGGAGELGADRGVGPDRVIGSRGAGGGWGTKVVLYDSFVPHPLCSKRGRDRL